MQYAMRGVQRDLPEADIWGPGARFLCVDCGRLQMERSFEILTTPNKYKVEQFSL
jgi:hypothetical protein